jgi:hypothetical protein
MTHENTTKPRGNTEASGEADVRMVSGTPPVSPTARLNVRLRRYTAVLMAHDHMEVRTDMVCNMAAAQSRSVRHGRYAFPSI